MKKMELSFKNLWTVAALIMLIAPGCSLSGSNKKDRPDHIVVVIEENHAYDQIIGSAEAPYITSLAKGGLLFTDAHGIIHPSQPNYIALFSGSTQGVKNDRCLEKDPPFSTPNLGHELLSHNLTFVGYSETMPQPGFTGCGKGPSTYENSGPLYARKHNPWVDWQGNTPNGLPANTNQPFSNFPKDFSKLPTVAFVVPNQDNEMHNGPDSLSIARGDRWLKKHMDGYVQWAKRHNSLFILTYDEDNFTTSNRIPTLFIGEGITPSKEDSTVNHYNVLRTIEDWYDLPHAGPAKEKAVTSIWN